MSDMRKGRAGGGLGVRSMLSFLLVGAGATGIQYALTLLLVLLWALPLVAASALAFTTSAIANYQLNARWTFRSQQAHRVTAPRFVATACAGLLINSAVLALLLRAGVHAIAAQILSTTGVFTWNYIINAVWSFKVRAN